MVVGPASHLRPIWVSQSPVITKMLDVTDMSRLVTARELNVPPL